MKAGGKSVNIIEEWMFQDGLDDPVEIKENIMKIRRMSMVLDIILYLPMLFLRLKNSANLILTDMTAGML